jgi:hypothetical protein
MKLTPGIILFIFIFIDCYFSYFLSDLLIFYIVAFDIQLLDSLTSHYAPLKTYHDSLKEHQQHQQQQQQIIITQPTTEIAITTTRLSAQQQQQNDNNINTTTSHSN